MSQLKRIALMTAALSMALAGCATSPEATLDEAIAASAELRDTDVDELVIQPRLGQASEIIEFTPGAGEWWVYLRCLGQEARAGVSVDGTTTMEEQECGEGMLGSAHSAEAGETVRLGVEAPSDTYWVLMVERRNES